MSKSDGLLGLINQCCFGCPFDPSLSAYDLLMFALGSSVVISILIFYYNRIPKSGKQISELENPIYQSKDILLQSKMGNANYLVVEKSPSILVKGLIYAMILVVVFTPLYKLLGTEHFF